ncbi:MAG: hypothetical protein CYPHOPRED_003328, partial [Cyphobasidiales sp. Tagirdzhanova-0007]
LEIVGIGQEGHSPDQPLSYLEALHQPDFLHQRLLPTLDDQITRKISHVDYLREQYGSELRLVLIGHSVGVYICQEVLKARPNAIDAVFGLFPTICHIAMSPSGIRLSPIFRAPSITLVATLLTLLNFLIPFAALHLLVRLATGQRMPASKVTTQLISSPAVVASCLAMGADEMCAIEDLDEACTTVLYEFGSRITLYFAAGASDGWVGSHERILTITTALDKSKQPGDERKRPVRGVAGKASGQLIVYLKKEDKRPIIVATYLLVSQYTIIDAIDPDRRHPFY